VCGIQEGEPLAALVSEIYWTRMNTDATDHHGLSKESV